MTDKFAKLAEPFERKAVHWRAQTVTKTGDKALALAYIDARDVMNRLDTVLGPENWQDEYSSANGRTVCRLGVRVGDEWIWKSDGAGDTAVEAEKGGISDAFKRAAVKWGVGRYLYDLPTPWVPCESYEKSGKQHFRRFAADPWKYVSGDPEPQDDGPPPDKIAAGIVMGIGKCDTLPDLAKYWDDIKEDVKRLPDKEKKRVTTEKDRRKKELEEIETSVTP